MNKVPDRKKLRREYLSRGGWSVVLCVTEVLLLTVGYLYLVYNAPHKGDAGRVVLILGLFVVLGALLLGNEAKKDHRATRDRIVPPITPDTLPADEILLRGSEEPPVGQSELLLRAARGQETPKEELLRLATGEETTNVRKPRKHTASGV